MQSDAFFLFSIRLNFIKKFCFYILLTTIFFKFLVFQNAVQSKIHNNTFYLIDNNQEELISSEFPFLNILSNPTEFDQIVYRQKGKSKNEFKYENKFYNATEMQSDDMINVISASNFQKEKKSQDEDIIYYDSNFNKTNDIHLIMFLANWCPVCHRYLPTWSQVSGEYMKSRTLNFDIFDCAKDMKNMKMCGTYKVKTFPTLYAFFPKERGTPICDDYFMSLDNSTYIVQIPVEKRNFEDVLKWIRDVLNIQSDNEMYNDTSTTNDSINDVFHIVRTIKFSKKLSIEQKSEFIALIEKIKQKSRWDEWNENDVDQKSKSELLIRKKNNDSNAYLHDAIAGFLYILRNWVVQSTGLNKQQVLVIIKLLHYSNFIFPGKTFKSDLNKLINFLLSKLLFQNENNNKNIKSAINTFDKFGNFSSLKKRILYKNEERAQFNKSLHTPSIDISSTISHSATPLSFLSTIISSEEWESYLDQWSFGSFKPSPLGVTPKMKICEFVYCGPWIFFHFMSSGLQKQYDSKNDYNLIIANNNSSDCNKENNKTLKNYFLSRTPPTPFELLKTIKALIEFFFKCTSCRNHFLQMYSNCAYDLCTLFPFFHSYKPPKLSSHLLSFFTLENRNVEMLHMSSLLEETNHSFLDENEVHRLHNFNDKSAQNFFFFSPSSYELLVFWLWRLHNTVNVRTAAEDTANAYKIIHSSVKKFLADELDFEDLIKIIKNMNLKVYTHIDVRWPSITSCSSCRIKGRMPLVVSKNMIQSVLKNKAEVDDYMWDRYYDYDWENTKNYIYNCFWNDTWTGANDVLYDHEKQVFYASNDTTCIPDIQFENRYEKKRNDEIIESFKNLTQEEKVKFLKPFYDPLLTVRHSGIVKKVNAVIYSSSY